MVYLRPLVVFVALMLWNTDSVLAQGAAEKGVRSVVVEVVPANAGEDDVIAGQVGQLVRGTVVSRLGMVVMGNLSAVDEVGLRELDGEVAAGLKRMEEPRPERNLGKVLVVAERAWVNAKGRLGDIPALSMARVYRLMGLTTFLSGDLIQAQEYFLGWLNIGGGEGKNVVARHLSYKDFMAKTEDIRSQHKAQKVTVKCDKPGCRLKVDGTEVGSGVVDVAVMPGPHLVQAEAFGCYRSGWLRSVERNGVVWALEPKVLETEERRAATLAIVVRALASGEASRDQLWPHLRVLAEISGAEGVVVMRVGGASSGGLVMQAVFGSVHGVALLDRVYERDASFLARMEADLLVLCDWRAIRERDIRERAERADVDLGNWQGDLSMAMRQAEVSLGERALAWRGLGEIGKAQMMEATVLEIAGLRSELEVLRMAADVDQSERRRQTGELAERWKFLDERTRSFLAWDLEAARRGRKGAEVVRMFRVCSDGLDVVRTGYSSRSKELDSSIRKRLEAGLAGLDKVEARLSGMVSGDASAIGPADLELLYGFCIGVGELGQLLQK